MTVESRSRVLLTVSGVIPESLDAEVAAGLRPRADYRVLAEQMDADVVDVTRALAETGRVGRVLQRAGAGVLLGWYAFRHRRRYSVLLTDGEQVGIPLALLTRLFGRGGSRHVMIAHVLSVPKKARLIATARLASQIDRFVVYSSWQAGFVVARFGVDASRVVHSTFMVDARFFDPSICNVPQRRMISAAGLERRDYPTLMAAVGGLDVEVLIATASPWSKWADSTADRPLPDNVTIVQLSLLELRQMYAAAQFVVVPLTDVDFQAGITAILEAMAMGKAVVCTRTRGQTDTVIDGETGVYVAPGDVAGMRQTIASLLADEERTSRLGEAAREWVLAQATIERYAEALDQVVTGTLVATESGRADQ
ncbi:MAG TPA: glycosyltransferase family 4 protein [Ilumatobacter sp.]|nr:glycosyltransferase family 4 protein [Ilumatobacter sp.]